MTSPTCSSHLLVDFQRFESIMRDHDLVSFVGQHIGRDISHVRLVFYQKNVFAFAVRIFNSRPRRNAVATGCF